MDPRALETLRTVGTQGGVTAAAAVLHLTPSAVSQQVALLQREVGVPLTERVGRGLRLTPAGEALAEAAVDVAVALERARAACDEFLERPQGVVRVSAFQSGAQLLLPALLTRVAAIEGITLECTDEDVAQDDFVALTDRMDVVVAHRPDDGLGWAGGRAVQVVPLLREPLDVAVPLDHPLAQRAEVRPDDLRDLPWIAVREGFPVATVLGAVGAPLRGGTADRAPRQRLPRGRGPGRGRSRGVAAAPVHVRGRGARAAGAARRRPGRPADRRAPAPRPRRAPGGPPGPRRAPCARGGYRYRLALRRVHAGQRRVRNLG